MDKITGLIGILGEENNKKIKDKVTQFIIDAVEDDISAIFPLLPTAGFFIPNTKKCCQKTAASFSIVPG